MNTKSNLLKQWSCTKCVQSWDSNGCLEYYYEPAFCKHMLGMGNERKETVMTVSLLGTDLMEKKPFKCNEKLIGFWEKRVLIKFWSVFMYRMYHIDYTIPQYFSQRLSLLYCYNNPSCYNLKINVSVSKNAVLEFQNLSICCQISTVFFLGS